MLKRNISKGIYVSNTVIVITFWLCTLTAAQIHDINNLINMNTAMLADKSCVCVFFFKSGANHLINRCIKGKLHRKMSCIYVSLLWFNFTLDTIWYFSLQYIHCDTVHYYTPEERKILNYTKGKIVPQHVHSK